MKGLEFLTITIFFAEVIGGIDRWGLVSFFSRSKDSLTDCIKSNELLWERLKDQNMMSLIAEYQAGMIFNSTLSLNELDDWVKRESYYDESVQRYHFISYDENEWPEIIEAIKIAILECSDYIDPTEVEYLPRFLEEPDGIGSLLDYILVERLYELPEMMESPPDLELLTRFAWEALGHFEVACTSASSGELHGQLQRYWDARAKYFFDNHSLYEYIEHDYTRADPTPHTDDEPNIFFGRDAMNFDVRSPKIDKTYLEALLTLYDINPSVPAKSLSHFRRYEISGYRASDDYLEQQLFQFYKLILILFELLEKRVVLIDESTGIHVLTAEMPAEVQMILHEKPKLRNYLRKLRTRETTHQPIRCLEDLILLRWTRLKKLIQKIPATTLRPAPVTTVDRWGLVSFSKDRKTLTDCIERNQNKGITAKDYDSLSEHTVHIKTINELVQKTQESTASLELRETMRNAILKCADPVDETGDQYLPHFIDENGLGSLLDLTLVRWPKSPLQMTRSPETLGLMTRFALEVVNQIVARHRDDLHAELRRYWDRRATFFFDSHSSKKYIEHLYTWENPVPHYHNDPAEFNNRFNLENEDVRKCPLQEFHLENWLDFYTTDVTNHNYSESFLTESSDYLENSLVQLYQIVFVFIELLEREIIMINQSNGISVLSNEIPEEVSDILSDRTWFRGYVLSWISRLRDEISDDEPYYFNSKRSKKEKLNITLQDLVMLRWTRFKNRVKTTTTFASTTLNPTTVRSTPVVFESKKGKGFYVKSKLTGKCFSVSCRNRKSGTSDSQAMEGDDNYYGYAFRSGYPGQMVIPQEEELAFGKTLDLLLRTIGSEALVQSGLRI